MCSHVFHLVRVISSLLSSEGFCTMRSVALLRRAGFHPLCNHPTRTAGSHWGVLWLLFARTTSPVLQPFLMSLSTLAPHHLAIYTFSSSLLSWGLKPGCYCTPGNGDEAGLPKVSAALSPLLGHLKSSPTAVSLSCSGAGDRVKDCSPSWQHT